MARGSSSAKAGSGEQQSGPRPEAPPGMGAAIAWHRWSTSERWAVFAVVTVFWAFAFWMFTDRLSRFPVATLVVFALALAVDLWFLEPVGENVVAVGRDWVLRRRRRRLRWVETTAAVRVRVYRSGGRSGVKSNSQVEIHDGQGRSVRFRADPLVGNRAFDRTLRAALVEAEQDHEVDTKGGLL